MEIIGSVTIDDSKYQGSDQYCDGPVEDEILEIVSTRDESEYEDIIEEKLSWPVLYHLSYLRENIVTWLPSNKNAKVLEIGAGCGAITGTLSDKFGEVTCVDLSMKRSMINAKRHQSRDNITIKVGNFEDVEPDLPADYEYIFLIGVFEYARGYIHSETPFEDFLNIIRRHLAPGGRIVIAIENQYGLKYFAGCREDHAGLLYEGIADYPGEGVARTFGRKGLAQIFDACGVEEYHFYYPYPDYKFPTAIYSDRYLPKVGELTNNMRNFDNERLLTFDEKDAFDGMIRQGYFQDFSNSFLVILGSAPEVSFTKFSNDRRPKYRIRTSICDFEERLVIKYPDHESAKGHIAALEEHSRQLKNKYDGSSARINECRLIKASGGLSACFEYLEGISLEEILDNAIFRNQEEEVRRNLSRFEKLAAYREKEGVSDYDLIFANILVSEEDEWSIIDYEWTFPVAREGAQTMSRAMLVYMTGPEKRRKWLFEHQIPQKYGITPDNLEEHALLEREFQHEVTGSRRSMYELYDVMKRPCLPFLKAYNEWEKLTPCPHVYQVYLDEGKGFNEEHSERYTDAFGDAGKVERMTYFADSVRALRIDPVMEKCILSGVTILVNGKIIPISLWKSNAVMTPSGNFMFGNNDPHFEIGMKALRKVSGLRLEAKNELTFVSNITYINDEMSEALFGKDATC